MAKKSASKAEKTVNATKKKASAANNSSKTSTKKPAAKKPPAAKKNPKVSTEYENPISNGVTGGIICLFLFVLFVLILFKPEGALLLVTRSVVLGLIGEAGLLFFTPVFAYVAFINLFGRKTAVKMRSICAMVFAFLCGVIYHLIVSGLSIADGFAVIPALYSGGASGTAGGVLCGGFAILLHWACGTALSYLLSILGVVLTLLGAMQITIPSIIRAIANRPRPDWEDEEDDFIEPAAIVVNRIANKQIEQKRQRREQAQQARLQASAAEPVPEVITKKQELKSLKPERKQPAVQEQKPKTPVPEETAQNIPQDTVKQVPGKGAAFMDRIDGEISAPLTGTSSYVQEDIPNVFEEPVAPIRPVRVEAEELETEIPARMPELKREEPVPAAPKASAKQPGEQPSGKVTSKDTAASAKQVAAEIAKGQKEQKPEYCFPPIDLLKRPARGAADGTEEMRENSRCLNETLAFE